MSAGLFVLLDADRYSENFPPLPQVDPQIMKVEGMSARKLMPLEAKRDPHNLLQVVSHILVVLKNMLRYLVLD